MIDNAIVWVVVGITLIWMVRKIVLFFRGTMPACACPGSGNNDKAKTGCAATGHRCTGKCPGCLSLSAGNHEK